MGFKMGFGMKVAVRGVSSVGNQEWKKAAKWYASALLGTTSERVGVSIELTPYLRGNCGSVTCSDWRRPRHFLIQIQTGTYKRRKQLTTLAHEFVHLKQIVLGELVVECGQILWKAARPSDFQDEPWESEAWAREKTLYEEYQASL